MSADRGRIRNVAVTAAALLLVPGLTAAQQRGQRSMAADTAVHRQMDTCPGMDMMSRMMSRGMMTTGGSGMMQGSMAQEGMGGMMMSMWGGDVMPRVMRFQPDRVLKERVALELDADQVTRLETLRSARQESHHMAMQTMRSASHALQEAFDAERPDSSAVRAAAEAAMKPHVTMHAAMVADAAAARAILTPVQREKLLALSPVASCPGMQPSSPDDSVQGRHEQHHPARPVR